MSEIDFKQVAEIRVGKKTRVLVVDLRGAGRTGRDDRAEFTSDGEVVQPLGLLTRPAVTDTLEALMFRTGDQDIAFCFTDKGLAKIEAADLDEGETQLHGCGPSNIAARIRIRDDGDIEILPASGKKVWVGDTTGTHTIGYGDTIKAHLEALKTAFDTHQHVETGGTTNVPTVLSPSVPAMESVNAVVR